MKKRFLVLLILLLLILPTTALAEDVLIFENHFTDWADDAPVGWEFSAQNGTIEQADGAAVLSASNGCARLVTQIELSPSSAYCIRAEVSVDDVPADTLGAFLGILGQYADAGYLSGTTDPTTIELYVETNVDEEQFYSLAVALGDAENPTSGSLTVDSVTITALEVFPEDVNVYSLIGSFADASADQAEEEVVDRAASVVSYNTTGTVLVGILFSLLIYLFFTSRHRFADRLSDYRVVTIIFVFAFLLRVYLSMRCEGHITDLNCFKAWAVNLQTYGLSGFYESGIFADYMPGYYYILAVIGKLYNLFGLAYDSAAFQLLVELVPILCDLALALFAYRIVRKEQNERLAALAAIFLLYMPFLFTDSVIWGQIDSVFTLVLLASFYCLKQNHKLLCCIFWAVALMVKPQALLAAPVIAIVFLKDIFRNPKAILEALLGVLSIFAVVFVLSLPMRGSQSLLYIFERLFNTTAQYAYGTVNAFNFFGALGGNFVTDTTPLIFGISYRVLGWIFIALVTVFLALLYFKKGEKKDVFLYGGLYLLLIYLFAHNMHERYIYPALVFLAISAFSRDSRALLFPTTILGGLFFANQYIVLEFRQELIYAWVTNLFSVLYVVFGLLTVVLAVYLLFRNRDRAILAAEHEPKKDPLLRLKSAPHVDRRMKPKDWLIVLILTLLYAVLMLTNLGSTNIPEEAPVWNGEPIVLTLSDECEIGQMKYYAGYCEGEFSVSVSADGVHYTPVATVPHAYADMFRWQKVDLDCSAKYIMLEQQSGAMELREIAVFDADNVRIDKLTRAACGSADASYLIDEQQEAPSATSYMTEMYFDEVYHARTAYEYIHGIYPYEITHPPLGKAFIACGILLFGMNPFGWRFAGAVAGILMVPVLYIFAKRIFRKSKYAVLATVLFCADFMHYSLCRIATIDSFTLLFILLMYLCMYEYTLHNFLTEKLSRTFLPLGLCGLFFGLGAATKWISLYAGLGLAIIFFYTVWQRTVEYRLLKAQNDPRAAQFPKKLILTLLFCVGVFILLPAAIYCLSYLPYEWASPDGFGIAGVLDNQSYMFNYHGYLVADPHPYSSAWQTWPFSIRPVFFFLASGLPAEQTAVIWCMGNPLLWWSAVLAFLYVAGVRRKLDLGGMGFLLLAAFCQLAPNLLITREMFLYHYFTLVPFFCMGIVYLLCAAEKHKYAVCAYLVVICAVFLLFYPVLTGLPITRSFGDFLQWMKTWPI